MNGKKAYTNEKTAQMDKNQPTSFLNVTFGTLRQGLFSHL